MVGVSLKAVKPAAFDKLVFRLALIKEQSKIAKDIEKDYIRTTKKWKRKPIWIRSVKHKGNEIIIFVGTDNKIYGYIDKGTKKHIIRPKKAEFLRFRGSSYGGRGRPRASDFVYTKLVHHPGFKGYGHSKKIAKKWQPLIRTRLDAAIARAAKKSGHHVK
jgi:hypothetical protein